MFQSVNMLSCPRNIDGVQTRQPGSYAAEPRFQAGVQAWGPAYSHLITHPSNCTEQQNTALPSYPQGLE